MPLKDAVFYVCAVQILDEISKDRKIKWQRISRIIYDRIMTLRDSEEKLESIYYAYYESKKKDYFKEIISLKFKIPVKRYGNLGWVSFGFKDAGNGGYIRARDTVFGIIKVTHKEYFTFEPKLKSSEEVYNEIVKFIRTLPLILETLHPLNVESNDYIHIKILASLSSLIKHPDSLVVHYRDKRLGKEIRKRVETIFEQHGLKVFKRKIRAESGFDFENSMLKDKYGHIRSHSQLMSDVIANHFMNYLDKLRMYSPVDLAKWLKESVIEVSKWRIEQVYTSLPKY